MWAIITVALIAAVASAQSAIPEAWQVQRDLAYGPHELQRLDAYLSPSGGPSPVAVFVHGGGHVGGDKVGGGLRLVLPVVASKGYSVISINYRLAPAVRHQAQIEDACLAVRWIRANAGRFRVDPHRLALAGASAGGHIVTYAGFTAGPASSGRGDVTQQSCRPQTVINFFGDTDLRQAPGILLTALLGPNYTPETVVAASPIARVSAEAPPTLSLHGTRDSLVPYAQSVALHRALAAAGAPNRLVTVEGGTHGANWYSLPAATEWQRALLEWLDTHLQP